MTDLQQSRLRLVPVTLREAHRWVQHHHRHHKPDTGGVLALGVESADTGQLCGVAVLGRPKARNLQNGRTIEVTRVCTDGTPNACSFLYGRCKRVGQLLGYTRVLTYTLPEEGGASLRGAGWEAIVEPVGGGRWSRGSRPRADDHPTQPKVRWEAIPLGCGADG